MGVGGMGGGVLVCLVDFGLVCGGSKGPASGCSGDQGWSVYTSSSSSSVCVGVWVVFVFIVVC